MEQLKQVFSDSEPKAGVPDAKNRQKVALVYYNQYPVKLAAKSVGEVISTLFKFLKKNHIY